MHEKKTRGLAHYLSNMQIRHKLLTGFLCLVISFTLSSLANFYTQQTMQQSFAKVLLNSDHVNHINRFNSLIARQRVHIYHHLGSQQNIDMELIKTGILADSSLIQETLKLIETEMVSKQEKPFIASIKTFTQQYLKEVDATIKLSEQGGKEAGYRKMNEEDNQLYVSIEEEMERLIDFIETFLKTVYEKTEVEKTRLFVSMLIFGAVTLAIILLLISVVNTIIQRMQNLVDMAHILAKGDLTIDVSADHPDELGMLSDQLNTMRMNLHTLVIQLSEAALQLNTSTNQILVSSQQQAHSTSNQTVSINEFSAALTEMAATSNELGRNMDSIVEIVRRATALAQEGTASIESSLSSMDNIQTANEVTSEKFNVLLEKVDTIAKVLGTITSIADKTNLLSVNASIEAVKAGEFGKGFGVVASEIRRLADRTVLASQEIDDMIHEIQKAANASMMSMDKSTATTREGITTVHAAGQAIQDLISAVEDIAPRVEEMKEATDQQAEGSRQMTVAIRQIQEASSHHKSSAEKNSQVAHLLSDMAKNQLSLVQSFTATPESSSSTERLDSTKKTKMIGDTPQ